MVAWRLGHYTEAAVWTGTRGPSTVAGVLCRLGRIGRDEVILEPQSLQFGQWSASNAYGTRVPSGLVTLPARPKTSMPRTPVALAGWPLTIRVSPNVNVSGA